MSTDTGWSRSSVGQINRAKSNVARNWKRQICGNGRIAGGTEGGFWLKVQKGRAIKDGCHVEGK